MQSVIQWLHLIGLVFWAGGVFVNTLVLMPSLQAISPAERGKLMGAFLKRFAPMVWGAIILVAVTGLIRANNIVGISTLLSFDTRYGNILLGKIALVAVMILNGAYLGLVLGPRIASFAPPPGAPQPTGSGEGNRPPGPPSELLKLQSRMIALNWLQVVLVMVVIFLTTLI